MLLLLLALLRQLFVTGKFSDVFDTAPGTSAYALANGSANDEIHVVVVDAGGEFSGYCWFNPRDL